MGILRLRLEFGARTGKFSGSRMKGLNMIYFNARGFRVFYEREIVTCT